MTKAYNKFSNISEIINSKINYRFKNNNLLLECITHKSLSNQNYERMEFLGDAVIDLAITSFLYKNYPKHKESYLSREKFKIVSKKTLAAISQHLELIDMLKYKNLNFKIDRSLSESLSANVLEALIGAIYLDSNYDECERIILSLFSDYLTIKKKIGEKDAKTQLIEYLASIKEPPPKFYKEHVAGPPHKPILKITCEVSIFDKQFSVQSQTVQTGQQEVSRFILEKISNE